MKRNIVLLFALIAFGFSNAQDSDKRSEKKSEKTEKQKSTKPSSNKYGDFLNTRKLGYGYKEVKKADKFDYYQQYYWVSQAEYLRSFPHLSSIKPKILYEFIKEINPVNPTKELDDKHKQMRIDSEEALNVFFKERRFDNNPLLKVDLQTFVDPTGEKYFNEVDPERVKELVPKQLYTFTTKSKKGLDKKTYYLWIEPDSDKYRILDIFPGDKHKEFNGMMTKYMPNFQMSKMVPEVALGDRRDKRTADYYFVTPFQMGSSNIVYKTKDFETFYLVRYKKAGGPWMDVEINDQEL